jgi:hypothetical protein
MQKWRAGLLLNMVFGGAMLCMVTGCERKPPNVAPPSTPQVEPEIQDDGSMNAGADPAAEAGN